MTTIRTGDSVGTEPMEYYDEDVFVANLEDPAKKYADLTKKANAAKFAAAASIPEEREPPGFFGSKVFWVAFCWVAAVAIIIVVAVTASRGDDAASTSAPSVAPTEEPTTIDLNATLEPNVTVAPNETFTPTVAPNETVAPTLAPNETVAPSAVTLSPTVAPSLSPTVNATLAPTGSPSSSPVAATLSPTVVPTPNATGAPSLAVNETTTSPTAVVLILETLLPEYSQAALSDPTSPQSFAFLFVNYDENVTARTPEELVQRFALATLYFGLGRNSWTEGFVNPSADECTWFADTGSLCNAAGQMESLLLENNGLENGPIPPEIGLLTALTQVDMSNNSIAGTIPTYFGQLQSLETLSLAANGLITGTVPTELSSITSLQALDLTGLLLTGEVPAGLCGLETLLFDCVPASLCGCDCACAAA